jgi:plastocyanin
MEQTDVVCQVQVGGAAPGPSGKPVTTFQFSPETVTAKPGDTIRFMFMDSENSVLQTTADKPCDAKAGG